MIWWHELLVPVLDEFVRSYHGKGGPLFWQKCRDHSVSLDMGCTSVQEQFITGWALVFSPFQAKYPRATQPQKAEEFWRIMKPSERTEKDKKEWNYGEIRSDDYGWGELVEVPVKVKNKDGSTQDVCILAGGFCSNYEFAIDTIRPSFDVMVCGMPDGYISNAEN